VLFYEQEAQSMSIGTIFFIGTGEKAVFVGGHKLEGYVKKKGMYFGIPRRVLVAKTKSQFRAELRVYFDDYMRKVQNRLIDHEYGKLKPMKWSELKGYSTVLAFFDGHVWITKGGRWSNPAIKAQPPKNPPQPPVGRRGQISVHLGIHCAECDQHKSADLQSLCKLAPNGNWSIDDVDRYFESLGYRYNEFQGWLCKECIPK